MSAARYRKTVEECLSIRDLAARLAVSRRTIHRLISEGKVSDGERGMWPVYRVGGATRIPASAVQRYLERSSPA